MDVVLELGECEEAEDAHDDANVLEEEHEEGQPYALLARRLHAEFN